MSSERPLCSTSRVVEGASLDSYVLRLDERFRWTLSASPGAREWLARFAKIIGLHKGHECGFPTLRFIRGHPSNAVGGGNRWPSDDADLASLGDGGWRAETQSYLRIWTGPDKTDKVLELLNTRFDYVETTMMWQAFQQVYEPVIASGGLPVHSALVEHDGTGFLLVGVGGSGKTTCCERLPSGWRHLADDEVLIVRRTNGALAVHPSPTWNSNKIKRGEGSWNISVSLPLGGMFFLEKSSRDKAFPIGLGEAAARINWSANQVCRGRFHNLELALRREWVSRLLENSCRISKDIRAYVLHATRSGQFWTFIEDTMTHVLPGK